MSDFRAMLAVIRGNQLHHLLALSEQHNPRPAPQRRGSGGISTLGGTSGGDTPGRAHSSLGRAELPNVERSSNDSARNANGNLHDSRPMFRLPMRCNEYNHQGFEPEPVEANTKAARDGDAPGPLTTNGDNPHAISPL